MILTQKGRKSGFLGMIAQGKRGRIIRANPQPVSGRYNAPRRAGRRWAGFVCRIWARAHTVRSGEALQGSARHGLAG